MNKKRRDQLRKVSALLTEALQLAEAVLSEEQDCLENFPENLQSGERYERAEEIVDELEDVVEQITNVSDSIKAITGG